ncbi:putative membrane protein [Glaciihabitans tibetensis]|uniref:Putative membrane protein n=1 Tax=Glaciihabitans tibetensis TaxID=1266600 RepID=A0A2T0VIV6_9MICO|nr:vitamin K epoxide reductase family protein [Glaciihabitans tibetensis]PRY70133.1 putative membrane protein [Glaciihabitans tibetensis]
MTSFPSSRRPVALALLLIVGGIIGWYSAFELTLAKFDVLVNPSVDLSCDFSIVVQCGKNLDSWQGAVFGFPNPLIGLAAFCAPIFVGVAILAGAKFARWFWILFALGLTAGLAFVIWLLSQSIFTLGTLCPWCMVVWSVTIPMFWAVVLYCLSNGVVPVSARARRLFRAAYGWVPFITVASYLVIALVAQLRLDVLSFL